MPWAELRHAYGSGEDVPARLRLLAGLASGSAPDEAADEALSELDMSLYHQGGGVYPAAAAAMPFLVELAGVPGHPHRGDLAELLARFARLQNEIREPWRSRPQAMACRAALADGHEVLLGLLADPDEEVRTAAVELLWEYAEWAPRAAETVDALVAHDAAEVSLEVRLALLSTGAECAAEARALSAPSAAVLETAVRALAADSPASGPDPLRFARLATRRRLDPDGGPGWRELLEAALDPDLPRSLYPQWSGDGARLAPALARLCDHEQDTVLGIVRALADPARPAALRTGALQAAGAALTRRRSAVPALVPLLGAALGDPEPEVRGRAAELLAAVGPAGAAFDDRLASLLDGSPRAAPAAWALARHGDVRAVPPLLAALAAPGGTSGEGAGFGPSVHYGDDFYWFTDPPLREALVAASRHHPAELAPALRAELARAADLPRSSLLADALTVCAEAGEDAVTGGTETLARTLAGPHPELVLPLVEAAGPAAAGLVPALDGAIRAALAAGEPDDGPDARTVARALTLARARFTVTGEPGPLAEAVEAMLAAIEALRADPESSSWEMATVAAALAGCCAARGPAEAAWAVWPEQWLRDRLKAGTAATHEAIRTADALQRVTGRPELPLRLLEQVLTPPGGSDYSPIETAALRLAVALGPVAAPLAPVLTAIRDRDARVCVGGGWRAIELDEEARRLAAEALGSF